MNMRIVAKGVTKKLGNGLLAVTAASIMACGQAAQPKGASSAQIELEAISRALSNHGIGRVEIIQIPPRIMTTAKISTDMLEKTYYNKIIIRDINNTSYHSKLIDAFTSLSVQPRSDTADLRWGVIFYARNDKRLGAVYSDKFGRYGAVNNIPVSLEGSFFKWLDSTFSGCLQ